MTGTTSLRRRLLDVRASVVGTRVLRDKLAKQVAAVTDLRGRVDALRGRADRHEQRIAALEALTKDYGRSMNLDTVERERRDLQLGAVETRLADLEQRLADRGAGRAGTAPDAAELAEGRALLAEVRDEHARLRARMQVVSAYEERLRRVEESVADLYDGDRRHLV